MCRKEVTSYLEKINTECNIAIKNNTLTDAVLLSESKILTLFFFALYSS